MKTNIKLNKELIRKVIVNNFGKSHELSVEILEEILQRHLFELKDSIIHMPPQQGWTVGYKHFMDKYGFGYAKIRYAMRKLSKHNLVDRKKINIRGKFGANGAEINLKINFEEVKDFIYI